MGCDPPSFFFILLLSSRKKKHWNHPNFPPGYPGDLGSGSLLTSSEFCFVWLLVGTPALGQSWGNTAFRAYSFRRACASSHKNGWVTRQEMSWEVRSTATSRHSPVSKLWGCGGNKPGRLLVYRFLRLEQKHSPRERVGFWFLPMYTIPRYGIGYSICFTTHYGVRTMALF